MVQYIWFRSVTPKVGWLVGWLVEGNGAGTAGSDGLSGFVAGTGAELRIGDRGSGPGGSRGRSSPAVLALAEPGRNSGKEKQRRESGRRNDPESTRSDIKASKASSFDAARSS